MESSFSIGDTSHISSVARPETEREYGLPKEYGDNKIVLMVRDPWTVFSYWEISREIENKVREDIRSKGLNVAKSVLRVYNVTGEEPSRNFDLVYEFELRDWADRWYIHSGDTGKEWAADIGILCTNGEFFCLARSNVVKTPVHGMSMSYDEDWMCTEERYYRLFLAAGGYDIGRSSLELRESIERHLKSWLLMGQITSGMFGMSGEMFGSSSFHMQQRGGK